MSYMVNALKESSPETLVRQIPLATLARLGPKSLTALMRNRSEDHPGRSNETDVAFGSVTL